MGTTDKVELRQTQIASANSETSCLLVEVVLEEGEKEESRLKGDWKRGWSK